jgi:hypothetical protein
MKKIALAAALTLVAFLAIGVYPFVHNKYIHPLGRLSRSIAVGDQCEPVRAKFRAYFVARSESPEVQLSEFDSTSNDFYVRALSLPFYTGLFINDTSPFDDVQITVLCGADNRVTKILFVGD